MASIHQDDDFFEDFRGEAFLEHGVLGHPGDLHDEMTHVPLLVRWPDQEPESRPEGCQPESLHPVRWAYLL